MAEMPTFTACAGEIRHALMTALEILRPDPENPLTSMVVVYVQSGQLIIHAQHDGFVLHVPLAGMAQGDYPPVAIDGVRLSKLLAGLRVEERLTISRSEDGAVTVQTANLSIALSAHRAGGRPEVMDPSIATSTWTISTSKLCRLLDFAAPAMGSGPTERFSGGVLLHVVGGVLRSASTDGLQLMSGYCAMSDGGDHPIPTVMPAGLVQALQRLLASTFRTDAITVRQYEGGQDVVFETANWRLTSIQNGVGVFADYLAAAGAEVGQPIDVADPRALARMLHTVSVMADWVALIRTSGRMLGLSGSDFSQVGGDCDLVVPLPIAGWRNGGAKARLLLPVDRLIAVCEAFDGRPFTIWAGEEGAPVRMAGEGGLATMLSLRSEKSEEGIHPADDRLRHDAFVGHA